MPKLRPKWTVRADDSRQLCALTIRATLRAAAENQPVLGTQPRVQWE